MSNSGPRCLFKVEGGTSYGIASNITEFWSDKTVRYNIQGVEDPTMRNRWTIDDGKLLIGSRYILMSGRPRYTHYAKEQLAYDAYIASLIVR